MRNRRDRLRVCRLYSAFVLGISCDSYSGGFLCCSCTVWCNFYNFAEVGGDVRMSSIIVNSIRSAEEICGLIPRMFEKYKFLSVKIDFQKRSIISNALQFHWYRELEQQGDMTAKEYRRHCKYYYGCALRAANDEFFADTMREVFTKYPVEDRLRMMDFIDVTSTFDRPTMSEYLNEIQVAFVHEQGFVLTNSKDLEEQRRKDLLKKKRDDEESN